jgi:hypothetical protein
MYLRDTLMITVVFILGACGERATEPAVDGAPPQPDTGVLGNNTTCTKADPISLYSGIASISGSTATSINEYGTSINCGSSVSLMRAPQRYYHITLTQGKSYKFTLSPDYSSARLYLFTGCGTARINVDCASKGATGDVSASISKGSSRTILFTPPKDGKYYLAVDGTSTSTTSGAGDFQLGVEEFKAPDNSACSKAEAIKLSGGKIKLVGTTEGAKNEFGTGINCGSTSSAFPGNQVYYKVALTGGKTYLFSFTPLYSFGRIYIFRTTCTEMAINADCSSDGATGDVMTSSGFKGNTSLVQFAPTSSGTYTVAVDSSSANYSGAFELAVEEFKPPTNGACAAASPVALSGGKATIKGSTFGSKNEFGEQIKCGSTSADGPQVYYKLGLTPGQTYKFALKPSFSAKLYLFGDHCDPTKIDVDCSSGGASGEYGYFFSSSTSPPIYFKATSSAHKLAVDSSGDNYFGPFDLDIDEFTPAVNGACAAPQTVTLGSGTTTINGDTTAIPNEFGTAINCGNYSTILKSSQVYFAFSLTGAKVYTFTLTPDYSSARFYLFGSTCDYTSINSACGSKGLSGFVSEYVSKGQTKSMTFSPTTTGNYTLAVDGTSTSSYAYGKFKLEITTK